MGWQAAEFLHGIDHDCMRHVLLSVIRIAFLACYLSGGSAPVAAAEPTRDLGHVQPAALEFKLLQNPPKSPVPRSRGESEIIQRWTVP